MSALPTTSIGRPAELSEPPITSRLSFFGLSADTLRVWGLKSVLSLIDQALTSGAGFTVNILLARWLSPSVYGAFAVAFAASLFVAGFHNVLVLEPLSVFGPARHASNLLAYFRVQVRLHFFLVGTLSILGLLAAVVLWFVVPQSPLTPAVAASSIALPFFLLLWLTRRMCYVVQRPSLAVSGSVAYLVAVLSSLLVLRHSGSVSPLSVFLLIGATSLLASAIILWRLERHKKRKDQVVLSTRDVLEENWAYGRWLVGSAILYAISTYTQTFFAAAVLGLGAAGILRAMQIPSLIMTQIITATGLLVLPALSYDFGKGYTIRLRHKAMVVSAVIGVAALGFTACIALGDVRIERLLFNGMYEQYAWLIPVLALIPVVNGLSAGYSMALRASQRSHFDLVSNALAAPVAVVSTFLFTRWWGLGGAAMSMVLSFAILSLVTVIFFYRLMRDEP